MKRIHYAALTALALSCIATLLTATARAQDMLVGEYYTNKVWRVSPDGSKTVFAQPSVPGGIRFFGSAFDASGNLLVARLQGGTNSPDDPNNGVIKISPTGTVTNVVSTSGWEPSDIAFDPSGNLYVSTFAGQIRRLTPGGTFLSVFATLTSDAYKMSTGANGDLFVGSSGNGQIRRFSSAGANLGLVGTVPGFRSIQVMPNGDVLGGSVNGTISRFTPGGVSLGVFATLTGTTVSDMAIAPNGDVYTANGLTNTIQHLSATGVSLGTVGSGFATPSSLAFIPSATAVPEPSALALLVVPLIGAIVRRSACRRKASS